MNRYLVFAGDRYYPGKGLEDFIDSYDSLADAKECAHANLGSSFRWAIVHHRDLKNVVFEIHTDD